MNPLHDMAEDWGKARQREDPAADLCALATVDSSGQPCVRTVVLWDVIEGSFVIMSNTLSPKWRQLKESGSWEVLILWTSLLKQYRLRGKLREPSEADITKYWPHKRYELKLLDHYCARNHPQSALLPSLENFDRTMEELRIEFPDPDAVPIPRIACAILLHPDEVDVWHGREGMPERALYSKISGQWEKQHLVP
jgi:pyridoxine/pyridoxamine 5'-phosphate oxidase